MCKIHSKLVVSVPYQALAEHERLDVALLHEAVVEITSNSTDSEATTTEHDPPAKVFLSLLPSPSFQRQVSDICSATKLTPRPTLEAAYSRFANNNFTIHSHLVTYAHGVFPMASRLFNHSCVPDAMPRYVIRQGEPVRMEVVALCEISKGQEVCIPYLDPALPLSTREQMLEYTYGFRCTCQACTITRESFSSTVHPPPTQSLTASYSLLRDLRHLVFGTAEPRNTTLDLPTPADADPTELLARLASSPTPLKAILHESFLPFLSEEFSKLCHEPRRGEAPFDGGEALLALYLIVYPRFYPQIGMHLLEMAKATWNHLMITTTPTEYEDSRTPDESARAPAPPEFTGELYIGRTKEYLGLAREVLAVLGEEGDNDDGQLVEIATLEKLVAEEERKL